MQSHSGCEFLFPRDSDTGLLVVPTEMSVLEPSGNGLCLLPHHPCWPPSSSAETSRDAGSRVALTAQCDPGLWHRKFGHFNMQSQNAQPTHGVPTSPTLASYVRNVSCDSCLLHKAIHAPRNTNVCAIASRLLLNLSFYLWDLVNVPSPHGLRHCLLVIDHHIHYMWVRFLEFKDAACSELETILLEMNNLHARHHSQSSAFAPVLKFDSDSAFEADVTRRICASLRVGVQFSAPYAHHMLGKAKRPGALFGTMHLRCSTAWPSPIPCGRAM
jgi:hypothetical protein